MSPLQKIAMGMVIIIGSAYFPADPSPSWERYDALPDPLGWVLVLLGVFALARTDDAFDSVRWLAVLAAVVSVPMWLPQVHHQLDASGEWFASLPQLVFCLFLAREIGLLGASQSPRDLYVAKRFGLLVWGFALAGVLPVLAIGGNVSQLESPTLVLSSLVSVAFVYFLFRVHRREWLGGPGPLEVKPSKAGPRDEQEHEGRPPSS
ncbi:MAG: hypothetical protein ABWX73_04685 [Marmoricola sp.]